MEELNKLLTDCRANIEIIIDKHVRAHAENPSPELIEQFKKEVSRAVTGGLVHKGLGIVDAATLTKESLSLTRESGEEFMRRIKK